jgi:hypothetical protein
MLSEEIQVAIKEHIDEKYDHAESGWAFSHNDEDTITGDFLGNLRCDWKRVGNQKFRFYYQKIRGRGPGALEKQTGTDGIITIEYYDGESTRYKSFIFQAKKIGNRIKKDQSDKIKALLPNGNTVFEYSPNGYYSVDTDTQEKIRINELLKDKFIKCVFGTFDFHYDDKNKVFIKEDEVIDLNEIGHKLSIQVS